MRRGVSVCVSVCVSGTIDMPFGMWARVGFSNHVLDGGSGPPRETCMLGHARGRYIQQQVAAFYRITPISCFSSGD